MKRLVMVMLILVTICGLVINKSNGQNYDRLRSAQQINDDKSSHNGRSLKFSDQPLFEGASTTLIRPEGYREWVFVGSSLGLSYRESPDAAPTNSPRFYHNVYISPTAYHEFSRTGKFPEGTMMVMELFTEEKKEEANLHGSYEKEKVAVEVSVKDSKRFKDGWAYYGFNGENGELLAKSEPNPSQSCFACHDKKANTDHVFTQFYPILSDAKPKLTSLNNSAHEEALSFGNGCN